jgi:hypothetical protein
VAVRLAAKLPAMLVALAVATWGVAPAAAQAVVDLQLVLAVDVSGSVSDERFRLQQQGYAQAFRSWRVIEAIRSGAAQAIAVTMMQWTGPAQQAQVVPWMVVSDEASAASLADAIERTTRQLYGGGTSISGAIDHAVTLFPGSSPIKSDRQVVDVSGDGANNRGRPVPTPATTRCAPASPSTACRSWRWSPGWISTTSPMSSAAPTPSRSWPSHTRPSRRPCSRS